MSISPYGTSYGNIFCIPKVKLAVLKFYKVDDNNKISRLRKECPHPDCGPGVFMSVHYDRHYCGKCALTYVFPKDEKK